MPILTGGEVGYSKDYHADHDDHKWKDSVREDAVTEECIYQLKYICCWVMDVMLAPFRKHSCNPFP